MFLLGEPGFLFGAAETGPDDIRICFFNLGNGFLVMIVRPLAKGWGVVPDDLGIGESLLKFGSEGSADFVAAA